MLHTLGQLSCQPLLEMFHSLNQLENSHSRRKADRPGRRKGEESQGCMWISEWEEQERREGMQDLMLLAAVWFELSYCQTDRTAGVPFGKSSTDS